MVHFEYFGVKMLNGLVSHFLPFSIIFRSDLMNFLMITNRFEGDIDLSEDQNGSTDDKHRAEDQQTGWIEIIMFIGEVKPFKEGYHLVGFIEHGDPVVVCCEEVEEEVEDDMEVQFELETGLDESAGFDEVFDHGHEIDL